MHIGFWWGNLSKRYQLKYLGVDGWIILKWISKKWDGGMDLAQDRDRWRALLNAVITLLIP